ncbi:hypothetical protein HPB51_011884 [Rhipicephalus microplus]|uniref:Tick transposon n=1 Tax=Rhipicephalus microplus TaxID=6941 RepID=A0A9J6E9Q6_RHIMP|nr:hypothetical protein HPB51_011884 [Rhipicephalus microplus]
MASRKNKRPQLLNYFTSKRPVAEPSEKAEKAFFSFLATANSELHAVAARNFSKALPTRRKAGCILCQGRRRLPHNCTAAHKVDLGSKISIEQHNNGRRYILPVVFRIVEDGRTFWDVRPSKIARELVTILGRDVVHQRLSRRGLLTVRVATADAAIKLLDIKTLGGLSVEASIPTALLKNEGKIRTVPYRYSDQQILEKLRHLGVISVRRQYSLRKSEDGGVVRGPRSVIVLTFKEGVPLPTRVMLGDRWYPVEEYLEPPLQCYNCLRYGHCYKVCRGTIRCRNCAGPHHIKECTVKKMRCANCYGPHMATYPGCPKRRDAAFAQRIRKFRIEEELAE